MTEQGNVKTGIYFGDIEAFCAYIEEKFGRAQLEAALEGRENDIRLSLVYFPKINNFRGEEELQFEIQYYQ